MATLDEQLSAATTAYHEARSAVTAAVVARDAAYREMNRLRLEAQHAARQAG